jgi:hypothetical protein
MLKVSRNKLEAYKAWRKAEEGRPGCKFVLKKLNELVGPDGKVVGADRVRQIMIAAHKCLEPPAIVAKCSPKLRFLDSCIDPRNISKENIATMINFVEKTNQVWIQKLFTSRREGYTGFGYIETLHKEKNEIKENTELSQDVKFREMKIRMDAAIAFVQKIAREASENLMGICKTGDHPLAGPGGSTAPPEEEYMPFLPSAPKTVPVSTPSPLPHPAAPSTGMAKAANPFVLPSAFFRSMPNLLKKETFDIISADPFNRKRNGTKWVSKTISRIDDEIWSSLARNRVHLKGFKSFYINLCSITDHLKSLPLKERQVRKWWEWVSAVSKTLNPNKVPVTTGKERYVDKFYCASFLYAFQYFQPGSPSGVQKENIRERFIEMGRSSVKGVAYKPSDGPPIGGFLFDLFSFGVPVRVGMGPKSCVGDVADSSKWIPIVYSDGGGGMGSTEPRAPARSIETRPAVPVMLST